MLTQILIFIIVLSILILVHEFGHYIVAKKNGIWVEEFGIGLPPKIWGKQIGETEYTINALPFGGFVRLHGEYSEEDLKKPTRAFLNKSKKVRAAVVTAGVVMNFLLAILAFSIVYSFTGIPKDTGIVSILEIGTNSPAQIAKLRVGDEILSVDGQKVTTVDEFVTLVDEKKGKRISLDVQSEEGGEEVQRKVTLTPRENPPEGEGPLGVVISSTDIYYPPVWQRPFIGIYYGIKEAFLWGLAIVQGFIGLFAGIFKGQGVPPEISGPVGIFAVTSKAASFGWLSLINFVGVLSLNLMVLNILPFPALDGGRLLFIILEKFTKKKVLPKVEAVIHSIGMAILLLLLLAITIKDIRGLISAGSVSNFIDNILK